MGISMSVVSELSGPLTESESYQTPPIGYELLWVRYVNCYMARSHSAIPCVSWSYGGLVRSWSNVIAHYPGHEVALRIGNEGFILPAEVAVISEYLATIEPRPEHGEDFADRLSQLQELFGQAAGLSGGAIYSA